MAKLLGLLFLLSSLAVATVATEIFIITGRVYCDTCRAGFETSATEYIEGAKVRVECRNYTTGEITQNVEGVTNDAGTCTISISNKHEEEICEVVLVESSRKDCSEIQTGRDRARIVLTNANGINTHYRYGNSLGFLKEEPLPVCG